MRKAHKFYLKTKIQYEDKKSPIHCKPCNISELKLSPKSKASREMVRLKGRVQMMLMRVEVILMGCSKGICSLYQTPASHNLTGQKSLFCSVVLFVPIKLVFAFLCKPHRSVTPDQPVSMSSPQRQRREASPWLGNFNYANTLQRSQQERNLWNGLFWGRNCSV